MPESRPGAVAARYGGEDFAIILPRYPSQQALAVIGKICPVHANTAKKLINQADDVLFRAKLGRKNRTEIYFSVLGDVHVLPHLQEHDGYPGVLADRL